MYLPSPPPPQERWRRAGVYGLENKSPSPRRQGEKMSPNVIRKKKYEKGKRKGGKYVSKRRKDKI
jgi:hypothetical protein